MKETTPEQEVYIQRLPVPQVKQSVRHIPTLSLLQISHFWTPCVHKIIEV